MTSTVFAELSTASTEDVLVDFRGKVAGVVVDPTGDVAKMAFLTTSAAPEIGDWQTAGWETDSTATPAVYSVKCLVGPDDGVVELEAADYHVWVKVADSPETIVRRAPGLLRVT